MTKKNDNNNPDDSSSTVSGLDSDSSNSTTISDLTSTSESEEGSTIIQTENTGSIFSELSSVSTISPGSTVVQSENTGSTISTTSRDSTIVTSISWSSESAITEIGGTPDSTTEGSDGTTGSESINEEEIASTIINTDSSVIGSTISGMKFMRISFFII